MKVRYDSPDLYIDGRWIAPRSSEDAPVINPATEQPIGRVVVGTVEDCGDAVAAARRAFDDGPWPRATGRERRAALHRFLDVLRAAEADIAALITAEAGATAASVRGVHLGGGFTHLEYCAELAGRDLDQSLPVNIAARPGGGAILGAEVVRRVPVGVVGAITPFNFPFYLNLTKVAPALAMGNTIVLKPAPLTPLEAFVLADAAAAADLPPGVLNVITGAEDVGDALVTDPRVDLLSFTGSDAVGSTIMGRAAPGLKRVLLELGGKSALVVRHDADVPAAARAAWSNVTHHAGQGCALLTRHLVHTSVHDEFVAHLIELAASTTVGDPADPATAMGPLISERQRARVESYIDAGRGDGAEIAVGGGRPAGLCRGFFVEPTIFVGVDNASKVAQEEIFGPVGTVTTFTDDNQAVALANESRYGLAGAIYSADSGTAFQMASRMRTGGVKLNGGNLTMSTHAPFGGWKRSGIGVEHGELGALEYTLAQTISFNAG